MRSSLFLSIILVVTFFISNVYSAQNRNIFLVRHAEKQLDAGKDASLTDAGVIRATNIAKLLKTKGIEAVYSTDYKRTQQTAKPLAKILKLEVQSYDPRKLKEFSEKVLSGTENILIVGHSNTTPSLSFLLGGDSFGDIDESDYDRVYQLEYRPEKVISTLLHSEPIEKKGTLQPVVINSDSFHEVSLTYQMSLGKKVVGTAVHRFTRKDGDFLLSEKTEIKEYKINADINVQVNGKTLAPVSMNMTGTMGEPVDIDLNWQGNRVEGHSFQNRAVYKKQGRIDVERDLPPNVVERSSVLMLAHLVEIPVEGPINFQWYNSYDDATRAIQVSYLGDETITVPAGTYETYKLQFLGGAPSQIYYVSKGKKPKVIKIEIIAAPWLYELITAE